MTKAYSMSFLNLHLLIWATVFIRKQSTKSDTNVHMLFFKDMTLKNGTLLKVRVTLHSCMDCLALVTRNTAFKFESNISWSKQIIAIIKVLQAEYTKHHWCQQDNIYFISSEKLAKLKACDLVKTELFKVHFFWPNGPLYKWWSLYYY